MFRCRLDHAVITEQIAMADHHSFGCCRRPRSILQKGDGAPRELRHLPQGLVLLARLPISRDPLQAKDMERRALPLSTRYFGENLTVSKDKLHLRICNNGLNAPDRTVWMGWIGWNSECTGIETAKKGGNILQSCRVEQ